MNIHEYQAKQILSSYNVPVPKGVLCDDPSKISELAQSFGSCVVKAQVHSGGRGKAGGVKLANSPEEARDIAQKMLGMTLVTKQTGAEGRPVRSVLVAAAVDVVPTLLL